MCKMNYSDKPSSTGYKYPIGYDKPEHLLKTDRKVSLPRVGKRTLFIDPFDQLWAKCFNGWWKYPQSFDI